ncbi:MAG: hypothetical protein K6U89_08835 [Chloroflexi bacterium]|nr:hypothetical protein [Chloroflexota bacterium]
MISLGQIGPPPCPECRQPMVEVQPKPVKWHCPAHGWYCRLERGFLAKQVISRRATYRFEGGEVGTNFRHAPIRTNPSLRYLFYQHPPEA